MYERLDRVCSQWLECAVKVLIGTIHSSYIFLVCLLCAKYLKVNSNYFSNSATVKKLTFSITKVVKW